MHLMKPTTVLSLGCFLLALGLGWYIFTIYVIPFNVFGWILIIAGTGVIISSLVSWKRPNLPIRGVVNGLIGGLILSLFITSGFGFITGEIGTYRAEDTKLYTDQVTTSNIYVEVDNFNGPIRISTWDVAEYQLSLKIVAKGSSQQNAEDSLNNLKINLDNKIVQSQYTITLKYDVSFLDHSRYSIEVDLFLPADTLIDLDLESSNGGIYLTDISGNNLRMETSNGPLIFNKVSANSIIGKTSNGGIEGTVDAPDTSLSTSNSRIDLTLPCSVGGQYDLSTSNGNVKLKVSSLSQVGFDLDLSTSNGDIDITLPDLEYSQNQKTSKEAQSEGFSNKAVQIIIEVNTSNSNIDVETL